MSKNKIEIHSEQTRLALLEQSIGYINQTLIRIEKKIDSSEVRLESRIDALENKFDIRIDALESKLDHKIDRLYWAILGLYGTGFITLLSYFAKNNHWFAGS